MKRKLSRTSSSMMVDTTPVKRRRMARTASFARVGRGLTPAQKNQVQRIVESNAEEKYYPANTNLVTLSATPVLFDLVIPIVGGLDTERIGDKIKVKRMHIRGGIGPGDEFGLVRVIFFQWFPNSIPTAGSILLTGPSGNIDQFSQYSHDLRDEFSILSDITYHLEGNGTANTAPYTSNSQYLFNFTLKPTNRDVQFLGSGTTGTNKIWWLGLSDSTAVPNPFISFQAKTLFTDS